LANSSGTRVASSPGRRFNPSGTFGAERPERSGADQVHVFRGLRSVACVTSHKDAAAIAAIPQIDAIIRAEPIFGRYSYSTSVKSTPSGCSQSGPSGFRCGPTGCSPYDAAGGSRCASGGSLCGLRGRSSNCRSAFVGGCRSRGARIMVVP